MTTKVPSELVSNQVFGRRNVVINGAMQVAQRGTQTGLGASSGAYGATDRFSIVTNGIGGRMTIEQSTDTPSGFGNSVKLSCTTTDTSLAAGDYLSFSTRLEGIDMQRFAKGTSDAEKFAVSFYVKGNANATYVCELYDYDNFRGVSQTFSVTTAWTRVELSYPADTTGALDNDSNISFAINIYLHAGSNFNSGTLQTTWSGSGYRATGTDNFFDSTSRTLFLTGVQLEVGDKPTPFEHLPFDEQSSLCKRYYQQYSGFHAMAMWTYGRNNASMQFVLEKEMRTKSTFSYSGTLGNLSPNTECGIYEADWVTIDSLGASSSAEASNSKMIRIDSSHPANSFASNNVAVGFYAGANFFFKFDAEL